MGPTSNRRISRAAVGVALLAAASAGCASRSNVDTDPAAIDRGITAEVLRVAGEIEGVAIADLRVETRGGVVVLSGVQPTLDAVREILGRVTRIRGVTEVVNRIRVVRRPAGLSRLQPSQILAA
jgi:osmotically-inducible protein OsmY